jgi:6-pyruvoyltetrahydropterin/6-carboxytetrahydropterin synthase
MYTVSVRRDFIAQHYLIGGDWGAENKLHAHHYILELQLHGDELDQHGYLVDIVDIEKHLEAVTGLYRERVLNDQPGFEGLNPSIEHFARLLAQDLAGRIAAPNLHSLTVQVWENDIAWASYHLLLLDRQAG